MCSYLEECSVNPVDQASGSEMTLLYLWDSCHDDLASAGLLLCTVHRNLEFTGSSAQHFGRVRSGRSSEQKPVNRVAILPDSLLTVQPFRRYPFLFLQTPPFRTGVSTVFRQLVAAIRALCRVTAHGREKAVGRAAVSPSPITTSLYNVTVPVLEHCVSLKLATATTPASSFTC